VFPHCNNRKYYTWTSDAKTHNQIDHVFTGKYFIQIELISSILEELTVTMAIIWWL